MARYIDADAFRNTIMCQPKNMSVNYVLELVSKAPTADVVEVVRCKDCLYWETETEPIGIECDPGEDAHYCDMGGITRSADYCSYGDYK